MTKRPDQTLILRRRETMVGMKNGNGEMKAGLIVR